MTKLDVLTGHETIPVCVAYDIDGTVTQEMPLTQSGFHHAVPVYEELPRLERGHQQGPSLRRPASGRPGLCAAH